MKIKEEPIDLDYECPISKSSNVRTLRSSTGISRVKLDSTNIDCDSSTQHQFMLNENTNHVVEIQLPTQIPTVGSVQAGSSSLPACENWPGAFDFNVSFRAQQKSTKGIAWTYSRIKDKLYVGKDVPCPINFSANAVLPNDVYVRVMALYTSPEQVSEIVERCIHHSRKEIEEGVFEAQHLVRCESSTAVYHSDAITRRNSVVVPFENPSAGQEYSTYIYKFACFTSCPGGPNRRPIQLIFTLEKGNQVIGRKKLDLKICACPGRDRKTDEAPYLESQIPSQSETIPVKRKSNSEFVQLSSSLEFTKNIYIPSLKKSKMLPNKDGVYTVNTTDKECHKFLMSMKQLYEMAKPFRGITPEVLSRALQNVQVFKDQKHD